MNVLYLPDRRREAVKKGERNEGKKEKSTEAEKMHQSLVNFLQVLGMR